jgi:hypothetical protein
MMTIYKYELTLKDEQVLSLPADSEILSIQAQGVAVFAWVSVDTSKPERDRKIFIVGTGDPVDTKGIKYISTVQVGPMVWHFFEQ